MEVTFEARVPRTLLKAWGSSLRTDLALLQGLGSGMQG